MKEGVEFDVGVGDTIDIDLTGRCVPVSEAAHLMKKGEGAVRFGKVLHVCPGSREGGCLLEVKRRSPTGPRGRPASGSVKPREGVEDRYLLLKRAFRYVFYTFISCRNIL